MSEKNKASTTSFHDNRACAICSLLKIKCDQKNPCSNCCKKNCASLCEERGLSESELRNSLRQIEERYNVVKLACSLCVKSKTKCDTNRPCSRCVKRSTEHLCVDRTVRKRKSKTADVKAPISTNSSRKKVEFRPQVDNGLASPKPLEIESGSGVFEMPSVFQDFSSIFQMFDESWAFEKTTESLKPEVFPYNTTLYLEHPDSGIIPSKFPEMMTNYHKSISPLELQKFMLSTAHQWVLLLKFFSEFLTVKEVSSLKESMFRIAASVSSPEEIKRLQAMKNLFEDYTPKNEMISVYEPVSQNSKILLSAKELEAIHRIHPEFSKDPDSYALMRLSMLLTRTPGNALRISRRVELNEEFTRMSGYSMEEFIRCANAFSEYKSRFPDSRKSPFVMTLLGADELLRLGPDLIGSWHEAGPKDPSDWNILNLPNTKFVCKDGHSIPVNSSQFTLNDPRVVLIVFKRA